MSDELRLLRNRPRIKSIICACTGVHVDARGRMRQSRTLSPNSSVSESHLQEKFASVNFRLKMNRLAKTSSRLRSRYRTMRQQGSRQVARKKLYGVSSPIFIVKFLRQNKILLANSADIIAVICPGVRTAVTWVRGSSGFDRSEAGKLAHHLFVSGSPRRHQRRQRLHREARRAPVYIAAVLVRIIHYYFLSIKLRLA